MELKGKKKLKKGQPNGSIHVAIQEGLYGTTSKGKSISFTVYHTTLEEVAETIKKAIEKKSKEKKKDKK